MTRFLASVPGYVYAQRGDAIYVNLYAAGVGRSQDGRRAQSNLTQETRYPWDGAMKITIDPGKAGENGTVPFNANFSINLTSQVGAREEAVPSDLYKFLDKSNEPVTLKVNGENVPLAMDHGYAVLKRAWKSGDVIELNLPMPGEGSWPTKRWPRSNT